MVSGGGGSDGGGGGAKDGGGVGSACESNGAVCAACKAQVWRGRCVEQDSMCL